MVSQRHVSRGVVLSVVSLVLAFSSACGGGAPESVDEVTEPVLMDEASVETQSQELAGPCDFYNYYRDETRNPGGAYRCNNSCQCDGMRTCSQWGWCQGAARPSVSCTSPQYHWNEAWNSGGSNRCSNACQCDGRRTCSSSGWCQGTAR